jgi:superfamily II DNA helicase RecQ
MENGNHSRLSSLSRLHRPIAAAASSSSVTANTRSSYCAIHEISLRCKSIINRACSDVLSIDQTREFQVIACHYLSSHNHAYLSMIRSTAYGKSLVPLCAAVLRRKLTLLMVPLHGLGSDQVDKLTLRDKGVNAYYIDQHKRANEAAL